MAERTPFGQRLRQLRAERGMSLSSLATRLEVTSAYLSALETGARGVPNRRLYQRQKKLTLFWPFCASRQCALGARLRRGLRSRRARLSPLCPAHYGGRSRGPYTSEHKSHFQWPLVLLHQICQVFAIIPTAKKVDTFLAVLCLTPVRPWRTAPAGPSFTTGAAFAAMPCSLRGPQSRPLYQRIQESFSVAAGIIWDEADALATLANESHPQPKLDVRNKSVEHIRLANFLAKKVPTLSRQQAAAWLEILENSTDLSAIIPADRINDSFDRWYEGRDCGPHKRTPSPQGAGNVRGKKERP